MVLGMSLSAFTMVLVVISLIGIVTGFIVLFGLFGSHRLPGMTALFLLTTILTSVTGFLFPFEKLLPSHMVGIVSLIVLAIACFALYVMKLSGPWRWIYTLTAMIALYLNVFVLVIQSFLKIGPLHALAPSVPPSEPPFAVAQGVVPVFFVIAIIGAVRRFRPALDRSASPCRPSGRFLARRTLLAPARRGRVTPSQAKPVPIPARCGNIDRLRRRSHQIAANFKAFAGRMAFP